MHVLPPLSAITTYGWQPHRTCQQYHLHGRLAGKLAGWLAQMFWGRIRSSSSPPLLHTLTHMLPSPEAAWLRFPVRGHHELPQGFCPLPDGLHTEEATVARATATAMPKAKSMQYV